MNWFKSISPTEILTIVIFILYIVMPVPTPVSMAPYINSPVGLIAIFCITVALFVYTHPAVAILYIFVAYFLLHRSSNTLTPGKTAYLQYTASNEERKAAIQQQLQQSTPRSQPQPQINQQGVVQPRQPTLEEDVINKMAPIGKSEPSVFSVSTFSPVATNVKNASPV